MAKHKFGAVSKLSASVLINDLAWLEDWSGNMAKSGFRLAEFSNFINAAGGYVYKREERR